MIRKYKHHQKWYNKVTAQKISWGVCMETLYQNTKMIKRLKEYFQPYLNPLTKPGGTKLLSVLPAVISMQFITSISFIYKWFLTDIYDLSLNSYYHLLTYTEIPLNAFFRITVKNALSLIPKELKGVPVFLITDDTLQAKFGTRFECHQKMFDHAKHSGTNYLNGHCSVFPLLRTEIFVIRIYSLDFACAKKKKTNWR